MFAIHSDWCLLTPELRFMYLDPVLTSHLEEQADVLLGRSILEFVHPDERHSAEHDLGGVLESKAIQGSVTRYVVISLFLITCSALMVHTRV